MYVLVYHLTLADSVTRKLNFIATYLTYNYRLKYTGIRMSTSPRTRKAKELGKICLTSRINNLAFSASFRYFGIQLNLSVFIC
jgi:hypothetical protein